MPGIDRSQEATRRSNSRLELENVSLSSQLQRQREEKENWKRIALKNASNVSQADSKIMAHEVELERKDCLLRDKDATIASFERWLSDENTDWENDRKRFQNEIAALKKSAGENAPTDKDPTTSQVQYHARCYGSTPSKDRHISWDERKLYENKIELLEKRVEDSKAAEKEKLQEEIAGLQTRLGKSAAVELEHRKEVQKFQSQVLEWERRCMRQFAARYHQARTHHQRELQKSQAEITALRRQIDANKNAEHEKVRKENISLQEILEEINDVEAQHLQTENDDLRSRCKIVEKANGNLKETVQKLGTLAQENSRRMVSLDEDLRRIDARRTRRTSLQADPELAALDARLEKSCNLEAGLGAVVDEDSGYDGDRLADDSAPEEAPRPRPRKSRTGSTKANGELRDGEVYLRPLARMNLPSPRDSSVIAPLEREESQSRCSTPPREREGVNAEIGMVVEPLGSEEVWNRSSPALSDSATMVNDDRTADE